MKNKSLEQQKGLFTFFKEQQQEEPNLKYYTKVKHTHNKPLKPAHNIHHLLKSQKKTISNAYHYENAEQPFPHKNLDLFKHQTFDLSTSTNQHTNTKGILQRAHTQSSQIVAELHSIKDISKNKATKESSYCRFSFSPTSKLKDYEAQLKNHNVNNIDKETKISKTPQKVEQSSKMMQADLNSHSQDINRKKLFFKEPTSYQRKNAYILLKDVTKLPNIRQQIKSQFDCLQRIIVNAVKNTPYQRKGMKPKYQNMQRKELVRLSLLAELNERKHLTQCRQVSLINLNKIYQQQLSTSLQWQRKKKLIKSRLGIQL